MELREKAQQFPSKSGCYLMKGKGGKVLYVGKAKNLRSRIISYFNTSYKTTKTKVLLAKVKDIDFQLTDSESSALILEYNLIKKYSPKYNIVMRDDKSYPYVIIDQREPFPRLDYRRRPKKVQGVEGYGPFPYGSKIFAVLRIITKSFLLRDCSLKEFNSRKTPCLLYQIKQCSAPCVNFITPDEYQKNLALAQTIFQGKGEKALKFLEREMWASAEKEEFERASNLRDNLAILREFITSSRGNIEGRGKWKSVDIILTTVKKRKLAWPFIWCEILFYWDTKIFIFPSEGMGQSKEEIVINFLFQYYSRSKDTLPQVIVTPFQKQQQKILNLALNKQVGKIKVRSAGRTFSSLAKMAKDHIKEHQRIRPTQKESIVKGLLHLQKLLKLKELPKNLEAYDVAVYQGSSPTASKIVFLDGCPAKKEYRHYHLSTTSSNNDFASLQEALKRRLKDGDLPDVFVVDGGKAQVSAFREVLHQFNLTTPVVGIAKGKSPNLIIPDSLNPYPLKKNPPLHRILLQMTMRPIALLAVFTTTMKKREWFHRGYCK